MTWKCQECGRKFKTTLAAARAANNGCPKCGGVDIDLDVGGRETCCLCGGPLGDENHNAAPLAKGRCCNGCHPKVLAERIRLAKGERQ